MMLYMPLFFGIQSSAHNTHELFERGSFMLAVCQLFPPSTLTSTSDIPLSPAKAIPAIGLLFPTIEDILGAATRPNLAARVSPGATILECVLYSASLAHPLLCQKPS